MQSPQAFELRDALDEDFSWILGLAEELAEVTVAPLRGVWGPSAQVYARQSLARLIPYAKSKAIRFLVAFDQQSLERVGYLVLDMNHEGPFGDKETYIEDMGVVSGYLGKRVGHFLTDQAARLSAEAGVPYLGADISFANRRALLAALGNGFELESYRIVRPCTPEAQVATQESDMALQRQEQSEKNRRALLSQRLKRRKRQAQREARKQD